MNAQELIEKTRKGPLRHGEIATLAAYVQALEKAQALAQQAREAEARKEYVILSLSETGAPLCTFPGAHPHTVQLSSDPHISFDFLITTLRERTGRTNFIGSPGAATQAELTMLARASKRKPKVIGEEAHSLEDLGL